MKQLPNIIDIKYVCCEYYDLIIPDNSIIYCDAPYKDVDKTYKEKNFDYDKYFEWCREMKKKGHTIFISEYNCPDDFIKIWEKKLSNTHPKQKKRATEKLYTIS